MEKETDPLADSEEPFAVAAARLEGLIRQHDDLQGGSEFQAEQKRLERLTADFVDAVRSTALAFTRYPSSERWLLQSSMDDFIESAVSVHILGMQGVFNVGRRELRYMLELAVKAVYVDQQFPGDALLIDRIAYLHSDVPRSSVDVADRLRLRMLPDREKFCTDVHDAFGALSGYTHVSKKMLDERVRRVSRDEYPGFESARTLRAFSSLVAKTYDVVLATIFEGVGPAFTGDLFLDHIDHKEKWAYSKTSHLRNVSVHFDYKRERQSRSANL
ncbi:hypothetical protein ASH00_13890 [Arthrobacter sp. Soil782]|uniref:hypothetical protein n=1 Tax=Arthrobacter sp. Soil782 TaxID=1736410 RepID=UPI0006FC79D4|nr:hypothetical protein [Arthrobacter sp. Soil782]KRF04694.1 hypothetical protein ASH00_13890 [Arthrobacter sp. Soil782]